MIGVKKGIRASERKNEEKLRLVYTGRPTDFKKAEKRRQRGKREN